MDDYVKNWSYFLIRDRNKIQNIHRPKDTPGGFYCFKDSGKTDLLIKHSFDIDTTSMDKLTLSGAQNIPGMIAPESVEMVFWPRVIKD